MASAREPLLKAEHVVQELTIRGSGTRPRAVLTAVSNVSIEVHHTETLGLVGESGSGKTTLARALLQLPRPTSGSVHFRGVDLTRLRGRRLIEHRKGIQMVFQDPFGSLNPTWSVSEIVEEPLLAHRFGDRAQRRARVNKVLELVGLPATVYARRRPSELSGGQCQRVAIARAIALSPAMIVLDEAVSALDVLIQAQILNLLEALRSELGLSYLFISHDLAVVRRISDRLAVMHLGQLCETGATEKVFGQPAHPYTRALLAAAPGAYRFAMKGRRSDFDHGGDLPSPLHPPSGCRFRTRCPRAREICAQVAPTLASLEADHEVACHFPVKD